MASGPGVLASPGAWFTEPFNNSASALLSLLSSPYTYLDTAAARLSGATEYLQSTTGLSPTALYATVGAVLLLGVIPALSTRNEKGSQKSEGMARYGFSSRGSLSPFSSFSSAFGHGGVPNVTDDDFSYITSADLENHGIDVPRQYTSHSHIVDHYSHSAPSPAYNRARPEDDVMLIKHQGVTYPEHFPAYSIGDGKILVSDVRERVKMILGLSDRQAKRIKLYYKGRRLRDPDAPVCTYGVKDNSEVLMVLSEPNHGSGSDSNSNEDVAAAGRGGSDRHDVRDKYEAQRDSGRTGRSGRRDDRSPRGRDSRSLRVPADDSKRRAKSRVRTQSPSGSAVSAASAPVGIPGGPIEKLNNIAAYFDNKLVPLCVQFVANPPSDRKKREEEHQKLSETIMEHVLLKLDGVETAGEEGARARRKELVQHVQAVLKDIDDAKG